LGPSKGRWPERPLYGVLRPYNSNEAVLVAPMSALLRLELALPTQCSRLAWQAPRPLRSGSGHPLL